MSTEQSADPGVIIHMGIAEQGKLHALDGDHRMALVYYREAMRLATAKQAPELFFRHYLECMLESLERSGAYEEVLSYCERAFTHHRSLRPNSPEQAAFAALDLASTHQRKGVILLKQGKNDDARDALRLAVEHAKRHSLSLPLAEAVYGWLARGFRVDAQRLEQELQAKGYYSVTRDTVQPERAVKLPDLHLQNLGIR